MNKKLAVLVGILSILFLIGWTVHHKDGHQISQYSMTYDRLAVTSSRTSIPVECEKIIIKAEDALGSEYIFIGGSGVVVSDNGYELGAGDSVTLEGYFAANSIYAVADSSDPEYLFYICFN
jgi:hypothetical protein